MIDIINVIKEYGRKVLNIRIDEIKADAGLKAQLAADIQDGKKLDLVSIAALQVINNVETQIELNKQAREKAAAQTKPAEVKQVEVSSQ